MMDNTSPFSISDEDSRLLEQNRGFTVIRGYLKTQENRAYVSAAAHSFMSVCKN